MLPLLSQWLFPVLDSSLLVYHCGSYVALFPLPDGVLFKLNYFSNFPELSTYSVFYYKVHFLHYQRFNCSSFKRVIGYRYPVCHYIYLKHCLPKTNFMILCESSIQISFKL